MELTEEVTAYVRQQVALAEDDFAEIVENTVDYLDDQADSDRVEALARGVAVAEFRSHLAAQADWPAVTDSDRLTAAFVRLEAAGIVARESFTCCQTCGFAEIGGEVSEQVPARGFTFYHQQDAEGAVDGDGLYLAYGSFGPPLTTAEVGAEVVETLRGQGLTVEWDGDTNRRIFVSMTWRRRRVGALAEFPDRADDRQRAA
jgi:hypothetical protein